MPSHSKRFSLRTAHWLSADILNGLDPNHIELSQSVRDQRREFLWNAMLTEFDAKNLANYLTRRDRSFSTEYHRFKRAWQRDEWNHYLGFRKIYSLIYEVSEEAIIRELERDSGDFAPLERFLASEFKVCLVLAYDEIATFKSYLAEFPFYCTFGDSRVFRWFRRITSDELNHFINCVEIIKFIHAENVPVISSHVDDLIEQDMTRSRYRRTFVFDHYWYSQVFLNHCKRIIEHYFVDGLKGANFRGRIETNSSATFHERYRYL